MDQETQSQQLTPAEVIQLRLEYEAAAAALAHLVERTAERPARVSALHVAGPRHTSRAFLHKVLSRALAAKTMGDVVTETQIAVDKLARFDIFDDISVAIDRARSPGALGAGVKGDVDVLIAVREKARIWAKTGTQIGNGEGSLSGSFNVRNVFGGAERFSADIAFGTQTSSAFLLNYARPVDVSPDRWLDVQLHQSLLNRALHSAHDERIRGIMLRYRFPTALGQHELWADASWRNVHHIPEHGSLSVRLDAGNSVKCAIGHTWTSDTRDDPFMPTTGRSLRLQTEVAGGKHGILGGDVLFLKNEGEAYLARHLGAGWILSGSLRAGHLLSLHEGKDAGRTRINDRFFLGGPLSLRGFQVNGVGPRDHKDSIGGDVYIAGGVSLLTPLPKVESEAFKGHLFINGGSLQSLSSGERVTDKVRSMIHAPSSAVGVGFVYRHSMVRLEMNFCLPLTATSTDRMKRGIQFGLGLSFL